MDCVWDHVYVSDSYSPELRLIMKNGNHILERSVETTLRETWAIDSIETLRIVKPYIFRDKSCGLCRILSGDVAGNMG